MLQQIHPTHEVIPNSEYKRFYAVKQPPRGYIVWLAWRPISDDIRSGSKPFVQSRQERIDRIAVSNDTTKAIIEQRVAAGNILFRSTFAIGNVAFQVFGHNADIGVQLQIVTSDPSIKPSVWIWPVQRLAWWPPRDSIDRIGGFDGLHNAFKPPP